VLLDLFDMPAAPALLPGTGAFVALCSAMRIMSEVKSTEIIAAVLARVKIYLAKTEAIWSGDSVKSQTAYLIDPSAFCCLVRLYMN